MPGSQNARFRSGNLAEQLGLLLLKGLAAVADVPRTEDVGLDAIATLLRRDPDGNYYAEDAFVVQLKSDSQRSVKYRGSQLSWFLAQSQPMFIGRVSRKGASLSLYPTLNANQAALALDATQLTVKFGRSPHEYPWAGGKANSATVWLGEPLLAWKLEDMVSAAWQSATYSTLKLFLGIARTGYEQVRLGQCSRLEWSTNDKDSIKSSFMMGKGHPNEVPTLLQKCIPSLNALAMRALSMPEEKSKSLMVPLLALLAAFRDMGVSADPPVNVLAGMFIAARKSPSGETATV